MNVTEEGQDVPISTQAGLVIGVADKEILRTGHGPVNIVAFRSHKLKRKVRSTLAAETAAMNEAIEQGDLVRAHLIEFFGTRRWTSEIGAMKSSASRWWR